MSCCSCSNKKIYYMVWKLHKHIPFQFKNIFSILLCEHYIKDESDKDFVRNAFLVSSSQTMCLTTFKNVKQLVGKHQREPRHQSFDLEHFFPGLRIIISLCGVWLHVVCDLGWNSWLSKPEIMMSRVKNMDGNRNEFLRIALHVTWHGMAYSGWYYIIMSDPCSKNGSIPHFVWQSISVSISFNFEVKSVRYNFSDLSYHYNIFQAYCFDSVLTVA